MKKIFKRICSLILAIAIVLPSVPMKTFALLSGSIGGVYWDVTGNVLTISGSGYMADGSPWVAAIDDYYQYNTNVQGIRHILHVEIKDGVKNIGNNAFKNHTGLSEVTIPSSVMSIGHYAFYGCNRFFYEITLTEGVETIGRYAFADCSELRRVDVPSTVKRIGKCAFMSCSNLSVVSVPEGVTSIGSETFVGCSSLKNIIIPESVTTIGHNAFSECSSLKSITIPKSVMTIEPNTFFECSNLETIYYSGTKEDWDSLLVSEGNEALLNANVIYNVVASGYCGSEKVGNDWGYENNLVWALDSAGTLTISGNGSIVNSEIAPWHEYYDQIKSVIIKSGVTSIGNYGFKACSTLTSATIPDSMTSIPNYMFMECTSLKSVTIPYGVTQIPGGMFYGCTALEDVTIPESVRKIWGEAFYGCSSLTSIVAPGTIGSYAFANCSSLTSVTIDSDNKSISEGVFDNCEELKTVYYLGTEEQWAEVTIYPENESLLNANIIFRRYYGYEGSILWQLNSEGLLTISGTGDMNDYKPESYGTNTPPWCKYSKEIKRVIIQPGITYIGSDSFSACWYLTNVTIPSSVRSIGYYAFGECSSLESVNISEGVTSIGISAFTDCSSLTSLTIPTSVTRIESSAFSGCSSLTSVTIPTSVTSIGSQVFKGCRSLTSITIPSSVTSIGDRTFYNCDALASITIPSSVTSIGEWTFSYCDSLTSITISSGVTSIGNYAFYGCIALVDVYYSGSSDEWNAIVIGSGNSSLTNATIHFPAVPLPDFAVTSTANNATITAPEGGWRVGDNTFTVSCDTACYVVVSYDGGVTYTRLAATKSGDAYSFTAQNMDADTIISVGVVGDLNGDGRVRAQEARQALQASSGSAELTALQTIAADLNGDGRIRAQEARTLLQASSGSAALSW
ncbi:MAG: leucine-rich repeat protein [Clostridia bacterium]|nr:leucine-rich repeat protein [Clostridia bacterium]